MEKKSILKRVLATGMVVTMTTSLLLGCGGGSSDNSKEKVAVLVVAVRTNQDTKEKHQRK